MKKSSVLIIGALFLIHILEISAHAISENKYIVKNDSVAIGGNQEYSDFRCFWGWSDDAANLALGEYSDFIIDLGLLNREIVIIPDKVIQREVKGILGSVGTETFDVNPENPYMECVDDVIFSKDKKKLMSYPKLNLRECYIIPEGTEVIGESAFSFTDNLEAIAFPESICEIEPFAFNCGNVSAVVFNKSSHKLLIDAYAMRFNNRENRNHVLSTITLPSFNVQMHCTSFGCIGDIPRLKTYEQPTITVMENTLKWEKNSNVTYYEIYQKINDRYIKIGKIKSNEWTPAKLKHGYEYIFAVKPIAIIAGTNYPVGNYTYEKGKDIFPETFTIEGTMSADVVVKG